MMGKTASWAQTSVELVKTVMLECGLCYIRVTRALAQSLTLRPEDL